MGAGSSLREQSSFICIGIANGHTFTRILQLQKSSDSLISRDII